MKRVRGRVETDVGGDATLGEPVEHGVVSHLMDQPAKLPIVTERHRTSLRVGLYYSRALPAGTWICSHNTKPCQAPVASARPISISMIPPMRPIDLW